MRSRIRTCLRWERKYQAHSGTHKEPGGADTEKENKMVVIYTFKLRSDYGEKNSSSIRSSAQVGICC